jgi:hypothetical protein
MTEMAGKRPAGRLLPSFLMYLYSGAPMHLRSGVDNAPSALSEKVSVIATTIVLYT